MTTHVSSYLFDQLDRTGWDQATAARRSSSVVKRNGNDVTRGGAGGGDVAAAALLVRGTLQVAFAGRSTDRP